MDTGKRAYDDGTAAQEAWLQGSMLTGRTLTIVFVANYNPWYTGVTVATGSSRNLISITTWDVNHFIDSTSVSILSADQAVLRDVL
mmetsp:Transcript_984/g.1776  ORF Transcript_984/g.1776 Transcript_984/m.1776 type:complete len:86 (+) Transcript_984:78-335(+)